MPIDKLLGYAFLISMPLSFLDKTTLVREYYQGSVTPGTGFNDLHWIFLAGYLVAKLIDVIINKRAKSK